MSYINPPLHLYDTLFELQLNGYQPILAHPERYVYYKDNFGEYEKLKEAGCLLQVNALSIVGYYNETVKNLARKLLDQKLVDLLGTDMHHGRHLATLENAVSSPKLRTYLDSYPFKNKELLM